MAELVQTRGGIVNLVVLAKGDEYWYVSADTTPRSRIYDGAPSLLLERLRKSGNLFKTYTEASAAGEELRKLLLSLHEPVTDCNKLPKLTAEVFNRPDCPEWAKYAAVHNGNLVFTDQEPEIDEHGFLVSANDAARIEKAAIIPFKNNKHYLPQLIKRPVNKNKLPDWCKVGEWFWHPEDMAGGRYLKITEIRGGGVYAKEKEDYDPDYLCFDLVRKYSKQARIRPYNADEIPKLPFEVSETNSDFRTIVVSCKGDKIWLAGASTAIRTEELMQDFTHKGFPCGVLEHLENGKWVE